MYNIIFTANPSLLLEQFDLSVIQKAWFSSD